MEVVKGRRVNTPAASAHMRPNDEVLRNLLTEMKPFTYFRFTITHGLNMDNPCGKADEDGNIHFRRITHPDQ